MKRKKLARRASKKLFRKKAGVKSKNMVTPMRGGWRL